MKTLDQAIIEVDQIIKERNTTFAAQVASGELHRDVVKRRYNSLRLVRCALEAITQKEWEMLQERYLQQKLARLQQGKLM